MFQKLSLVCLISASARHKDRTFTTIAKNQWVLRWPLPLMEWYLLNHWDQWFFDGFSVSQPLATMFFNCCQPLVQRCDGNDTSFRSTMFASDEGWLECYFEDSTFYWNQFSHFQFLSLIWSRQYRPSSHPWWGWRPPGRESPHGRAPIDYVFGGTTGALWRGNHPEG